MSSQDVQESPKMKRKSLRTIQRSAVNSTENLVGKTTKKHQASQDSPVDVKVKRKTLSSRKTKVKLSTKITEQDLTSPNRASNKYWKTLAEKCQQALQDSLLENEKLHKMLEDVKEENAKYRQMLEEANTFIEVIKEELANTSNNDTGIDVNDVSTADDTNNDTEEPNSQDN